MNESTKTYPLVSLMLLSYNKSQWLAEGIESALAQDYPNLEVVVVDGGSTWNNIEIASKYPVRVVDIGENVGCAGIVNRAVSEARGDYIMVFSAEDPLMPGIISKQMAMYETNPALDFVGSWYKLITEDGKPIKTFQAKWDEKAIKSYCCMSGCFLSRKSFWRKVAFRDVVVNEINAYQDWDMWLQAKAKGLKGDVVREVGFKYRQHEGATQEAIQIHPQFMRMLAEMNKEAYA